MYSFSISFRYNDLKSFRGQIFGHYVWWGFDDLTKANVGASYDDFIWDITLSKKIYCHEKISSEVFFSGHNIFNGAQYVLGDMKNAERWAEAGMRILF